MARKFKHSKKRRIRSLYSYQPKKQLHSEELAAYKKVFLLFLLVSSLATFLYLWGIPLVATISSFLSNWSVARPDTDSTTPSPPPSFMFVPRIEYLPSSTNNLADFKITGWTKPGLEVSLYVNEQKQFQTITDANGMFEFMHVELREGENKIYARAVLDSGEESTPSQTQTVIFDKIPPELAVSTPKNGENFIGNKNQQITIKGSTEPKSMVTINDHRAIVNLAGEFTYPLLLTEGKNKILVKAIDEAGNATEQVLIVTYSSSNSSEKQE